MSDATRSITDQHEETMQHFARLDSEVLELKDSIGELKSLVLDIVRRLAMKNNPAETPPMVGVAESGMEEQVSQLPATFDVHTRKKPAFGTNQEIKIDLPRFNGDNPATWLFHVEHLFGYYETTKQQQLTIVSIYMDGPAFSWYQSLHQRGQFST